MVDHHEVVASEVNEQGYALSECLCGTTFTGPAKQVAEQVRKHLTPPEAPLAEVFDFAEYKRRLRPEGGTDASRI